MITRSPPQQQSILYEEVKYFWRSTYTLPDIFLSQENCPICNINVSNESKEWTVENNGLIEYLPKHSLKIKDIFGQHRNCATVTGAPGLKKLKYGTLIDSFPVVLRLNLHGMHPNKSYGCKSTHMLVNDGLWNKHDRLFHKFSMLEKLPEIFDFKPFWHNLAIT